MICNECGEECEAVYKDLGYGPYEYWGFRGTHHDYQFVSPCCDADVVEGQSRTISVTIRKARKDYPFQHIERGMKYREIVTKMYKCNGPTWYVTKRECI